MKSRPSEQQESPPVTTRVLRSLSSLANWISRPHPTIINEEARQNAHLLSWLLLTSVIVVSLIVTLVLYYDPNDIQDRRVQTGLSVIFVGISLYVANRFGFVRLATFAFITYLTIVFLAVFYLGNYPEFIAYLTVPMLLTGMFYGYRESVAITVLLILAVFILNSVNTDDTIWRRRSLWYWMIFSGTLILVFKYHLNQLEIIRRKRLDDVNAHLLAMLDALPDLIFEVDRGGYLVDYHVPDDIELDIPLDGFLGKLVLDVLPEHAATSIIESIEKAAEKGKHIGTVFSLELPEGSRWFEVAVSAKANDQEQDARKRFIIVAHDVTERRQAELLRTERARLEIELEKEKEVAQLRSQLISTIVHEFRTPLTVITTSGSLLVRYLDRLSPERHRELLEGIFAQVKRLDRMLNDVSNLSKTQRGFFQYDPQPVDIAGFCKEVVEELKGIKQPDQELVIRLADDLVPVQLDQELMRHAFTNLISNAIKYSPDDGEITVELARNADKILFTVSDQGIGIPPEDMEGLFQPFHRARNVGTIHGTGLGLSIASEAVALHGGDITCDSKLNEGTTFKVTIPIRKVAENGPNSGN